jgi:hypothetical protein
MCYVTLPLSVFLGPGETMLVVVGPLSERRAYISDRGYVLRRV